MLVITGEGLKTLDAVRGTFEALEIEPSYDAFEARCRGRAAVRGLMAVTVKIPTQLRAATGGASSAAGRGRHRRRGARRALRAVRRAARADRRDDGGLRRFVNVYIGGEDIRFLDGLDTPVADGDEVTILPAVAGG